MEGGRTNTRPTAFAAPSCASGCLSATHPVMPETAPNLLMTALVRTLVPQGLVPEGQMVRAWLDSWSGVGHVVDAMHEAGYNVSLFQSPFTWWAEFIRDEVTPVAKRTGRKPRRVALAGVGGFASRTMIAGAGAIEKAASQIRDKMLRIAGHILDVDASAVEATAGVIRHRDDPSVQVPIQRVSEAAFLGHPLPPGEDPGLEATAYFDPPSSAFGYGTVVAQVEVDARSGELALSATSSPTTAAPRSTR